ncbi:tpr repeat protein [Rutstroemia sp. NJR-2017a BBW]|nr:tpr repeat protein [Rutstroemia sp. NJR-2017a BBW]
MTSLRILRRAIRPPTFSSRAFTTTPLRFSDNPNYTSNNNPGNAPTHVGTEEHRKIQSSKPLNPHLTNTTSTIANETPSVGAFTPPPELISSVSGEASLKDSIPENTERMTGGTQDGEGTGENREMGVGELEGAKFRVEPLRRTGEDDGKMRARLLYQSRKRGTLESDLLMSTFADTYLPKMTSSQMAQYDLFLDENDWDIYYWATQEPTPTSRETAEGAELSPEGATTNAMGQDKPNTKPKPIADAGKLELETDEWRNGAPRSGEWAQTVGTFKPAYRPVPKRWKNSEILAMLRSHVKSRSAGGVHEGEINETAHKSGGGGMAFMPPIFQTDQKRT